MSRRLSFYIHVPYCLKRCGYCDFNTYTPSQLLAGAEDEDRGLLAQVSASYIDLAIAEIEQAKKTVGDASVPTIFYGGGTPTLLSSEDLLRSFAAIRERFDLSAEYEATIEANPDSVTGELLEKLREGGFNRISFGAQSFVPHVLEVLDRTHNPENVSKGVELSRKAGFEHVSIDLIYGTPKESIEDWQTSVKCALELPIDHISAYALIIEKGTKLAGDIKRGKYILPDDDETATKYAVADDEFHRAGFTWYELSNWAKPGGQCRHNIAYWNSDNWWGIGPGAHSFLDGKRWWNVKHPNTYQEKIISGLSPELGREVLTEENRRDEFVMLQLRMATGITFDRLEKSQIQTAQIYKDSGHVSAPEWDQKRILLTQSGRLIADAIVRDLLV